MNSVSAQFTPAFLQNESYWAGDKAEFDLYDAQLFREGELRPCEVTLIFRWDKFTPRRTGTDTAPPQEIPAVALTQMSTVPLGLASRQESTALFWGRDGRLLHVCATRAGPTGITIVQTNSIPSSNSISLSRVNERGTGPWQQLIDQRAVNPFPSPAPTGTATPGGVTENRLFLYEELPLRVRTIQFNKSAGEFEINLMSRLDRGPDLTSTDSAGKPAKITYKIEERFIKVDLRHEAGTDHFVLDSDFPFLLREWQMADGSRLRMKNSLRVDYQKYLKNGDRERALKDPMLRHPD